MKIYKVLKDFPTMRAGAQYTKGEVIRLEDNCRTMGLMSMGYIKPYHVGGNFVKRIIEAARENSKFEVSVKEK